MSSSQIVLQQWIDDKRILVAARVGNGNYRIFVVSTDPGVKPVAYMQTPFNENGPSLSPDGKMLAYLSNESGPTQVWMRDFPVPQGKWSLTAAAARGLRWMPDGKSLLFWGGSRPQDSLFRIRVDRTPAVVAHSPELVTTLKRDGALDWDLHPDGRRFVSTVPAANAAASGTTDRYLVVENWFDELRRVGSGRRP